MRIKKMNFGKFEANNNIKANLKNTLIKNLLVVVVVFSTITKRIIQIFYII